MTATEPVDPELQKLYDDFETEHLNPLWTQIGDLMPMVPTSKAVPFVWKWSTLYPLAQRAGDLVPVGRGGERRAIALANPGLGGVPYVTPTLWAAIQYLGPKETAPEHRHSQNAFRFVVEGEGVWTVVNGDPVAMRRGDFLLTPAGTSMVTTTRPISRWRGSTASTSRSCTTPTPASSSSAPTVSPTRAPRTSPGPSDCGSTPVCARSWASTARPARRSRATAGSTPTVR